MSINQYPRISFINKLMAIFLLAAVLAIFSYLNTVFGWTNPSQNPPGGSGILSAVSGKLGVNTASPSTTLTVNGIISAVGNRIVDVATPISGKDAVNKAYVDAQGGGGGGGAGRDLIVTVFGVSNGTPSPSQAFRIGSSVPTCLRGIPNQNCVSIPQPAIAGAGTPACSTLGADFTELYAGYGPMNTLYAWYQSGGEPAEEYPTETQPPNEAVIGTDSICSTASFANVLDINFTQSNNRVSGDSSILSACTSTACNTCRVCIKQ